MAAILGPAGLAGFGNTALTEANTAEGESAQLEANRQMENQRLAQAGKTANMKIGSAIGAAAGSFGGPIGTMAGATAGGMIGGLF